MIKASNSQTPQLTLPFNDDEVIYINQGDIVKYFETGDLKELVGDSGRETELFVAMEKLQSNKNDLVSELESFKNRYERFNSSYHKDFIIHEGDYDNMLNDKFHFVEVSSSKVSINFEEKEELLSNISLITSDFRNDEVFEFNEEEITAIETFENLIESKSQLLLEKKITQNTIDSFIQV